MANIMRVFKTPKGTELPLINLKGKEYMQVMHRWIWFVEENPRYDVTTDFIKLDDEVAIAKTTISILEDTPQGVRVVKKVTEYKKETQENFPDFVEKAATGASGRCLAVLGYGSQFAFADFDEGDRIVDSPVTPKTQTTTLNVSTAATVVQKPLIAAGSLTSTSEVTTETKEYSKTAEGLVTAMPKKTGFQRPKPSSNSGTL